MPQLPWYYRDHPGLRPGSVLTAITSILIGRGRGRFDAEEGNMIREARYCPTDFEDGRRGHEPGNVRNEALEARKGKETVPTLEFPEGGWPR